MSKAKTRAVHLTEREAGYIAQTMLGPLLTYESYSALDRLKPDEIRRLKLMRDCYRKIEGMKPK